MKYLIVGDLHGRLPTLYYKDFDAIIQPGDIGGDFHMRGISKRMHKDFLKDTSKIPDWYDYVGRRKATAIMKENVERGRKIVEKLAKHDKPVYIIPGNWDYFGYEDSDWHMERKNHFEETMIAGFENVHNVDRTYIENDEHVIVGYGKINGVELLEKRGYPGFTEEDYKINEKRVQKLYNKIKKLFEKAQQTGKPIIFISHVPPYGSKMDVIQSEDSPFDGWHYGSVIARDLIKEFQPKVCICAHFHEYFGMQRMGRTRVINAGYGTKKNVFMDLVGSRLMNIEFREGKKLVDPKL